MPASSVVVVLLLLLCFRCDPVYVQYQFPTQPLFRTPGLPQAPSLSFLHQSPNVMLLGTADPDVLLEHLRGPPLVLEVHDRDARLEVEPSLHALFGEESQDDLIGTHAFGSARAPRSDAVGDTTDKRHGNGVYGVATVDLGVLLSGQVLIELTVPVVKGPRCSADSARSSDPGAQILPGDYLESGCELTIKIEMMHPLTFSNAPRIPVVMEKAPWVASRWKKDVKKSVPVSKSRDALIHCPFNRIVYIIFAEGGAGLIDQLLGKINEINAKTLGLETLAPNVLRAALSTYKVTE